MTDTIKISRELLERILSNDEKISGLKMGEFEDACEDMAGAMMELRALLATPPADAADMGGQAGGGDTRKLSDIGNEIHNLSCHVVHVNEEWAQQLGTFASELWNWGGQAGEEVQQQITIVQYLDTKGSRKALGAMNAKLRCKVGHLERRIAEQCEELEILHKQLDRFREKSHGIPALAEHERLSEELAQHRQQAGKLVEARAEIDRLKDQRAYLRALLNRVRLHVPLQSMPGLLGDIEPALED